ncbi:XRE family transcriptional regulator [Leptospira ognonensis]|uniref:XRE family transcriptional regulator n=1 Tax=Leptospira ognonensis TaxID=2484945 RepID=A0A4R9K0X4_9LEPT|nr:helix-turn-helix transcriptional regulator [Leptospira ognonensis]TGL59319.1 XRE family transcriptional regulator [Leptospira ognonensis]
MKIVEKWDRSHTAFGEILRDWRKQKQISQLDFSFDLGISAKHLSFVETGRSKPSKELISKISNSLKLPMRLHNTLLTSAGYAPMFLEESIDSPKFEIIRDALNRILDKHEPYPAFVLNADYDILMTNTSFEGMISRLTDESLLGQDKNILKITFSEKGLRRYIQNWEGFSSFMLTRVWEEAVSSQNQRLLGLVEELKKSVEDHGENHAKVDPIFPVLHLSLKKDDIVANFFSTITTLGTPLDLTTQSLRIELLFPVDEPTKKLFLSL